MKKWKKLMITACCLFTVGMLATMGSASARNNIQIRDVRFVFDQRGNDIWHAAQATGFVLVTDASQMQAFVRIAWSGEQTRHSGWVMGVQSATITATTSWSIGYGGGAHPGGQTR